MRALRVCVLAGALALAAGCKAEGEGRAVPSGVGDGQGPTAAAAPEGNEATTARD